MNKSCTYCGRSHNTNHICERKPTKKKESNHITRFRNNTAWIKKRNEINERDKTLCQICIRQLYNTISHQYNSFNIQVHHIEPLIDSWHKRLDNDNLICLCSYHHHMAEIGEIPSNELKQIVIDIDKL